MWSVCFHFKLFKSASSSSLHPFDWTLDLMNCAAGSSSIDDVHVNHHVQRCWRRADQNLCRWRWIDEEPGLARPYSVCLLLSYRLSCSSLMMRRLRRNSESLQTVTQRVCGLTHAAHCWRSLTRVAHEGARERGRPCFETKHWVEQCQMTLEDASSNQYYIMCNSVLFTVYASRAYAPKLQYNIAVCLVCMNTNLSRHIQTWLDLVKRHQMTIQHLLDKFQWCKTNLWIHAIKCL